MEVCLNIVWQGNWKEGKNEIKVNKRGQYDRSNYLSNKL